MAIASKPAFTDIYESVESFTPVQGSVYVLRQSVEERSGHIDKWKKRVTDVSFVDVTDESRSSITVQMPAGTREVQLRSSGQLKSFWDEVSRPTIYLDITGLRHHTWAALLRAAISTRADVVVIYVEPGDYRPSLNPTEGQIYDLSERIEGIAPLPGFASLRECDDKACFVPLLGFEGTRTAYLITQVEPPGGKIVPVVGLPGFRAEYPFATYLGNRTPLQSTQAWKKVRYAAASCPFDLYYVLQEIALEYPSHTLKIAPIGTKPHAIGGVLFAINNPTSVELVYDHPIRKKRRTEGTAKLHAYHVSVLFG